LAEFLTTDGSDFIGSWLTRTLLKEGCDFTVLDKVRDVAGWKRFNFVY